MSDLPERATIVSAELAYPTTPVIYFLIVDDDEEEVIYVGETSCLPFRIIDHVAHKDFDRVAWVPAPADRILRRRLERAWICKLRPHLNREWDRWAECDGTCEEEIEELSVIEESAGSACEPDDPAVADGYRRMVSLD